MKLYTMPGTCALSVHIALEWIGRPYELAVMRHGDNRQPVFLAINPRGQVPTLRLDDGRVLTEASALLLYLADRFPEAGLGASSSDPDGRYALEEALAFMTGEVHPAFGPHFAPERFLGDETAHPALKARAHERLDGYYRDLDTRIAGREHLVGERRMVADPYLYVLARWADLLPTGIGRYPNLEAFRTRMEADPSVRRALDASRLEP